MLSPSRPLLSASLPSSSTSDPAALRRIAVLADQGGLDFLVIEPPVDALIAAGWLIPATRRVGLVAALPATYAQPFHVARALSAMDILSDGRIGWLPTTIGHTEHAPAFGNLTELPPMTAVDRAAEFVAATKALWDSWDEDALIIDKQSARYLDRTKIRRIDYRGAHLKVMGPLNAARPRQGYPLLVQRDNDPLCPKLGSDTDLAIVTASNEDEARQRIATLQRNGVARILAEVSGSELNGDAAVIADRLVERRRSLACDGFHIVPGRPEDSLETLLGILLAAFEGQNGEASITLRQRLGIAMPRNPYSRH